MKRYITTLKVGDYVYHHTTGLGLFPCVILEVRKMRVKVTEVGWVAAHKCQLQIEWAKENAQ